MSEKNKKYENYKFLGKELVTEGKKDDKEWKLFSLSFERANSEHPLKMKCFSGLTDKSIQLKDLEEGDVYNIGYEESTYMHKVHGELPSRQIFFIGEVKDDSEEYSKNFSKQTTDTPKPSQPLPTLSDFKESYLKACEAKDIIPTPVHAANSLLKNTYLALWKQAHDYFEKELAIEEETIES